MIYSPATQPTTPATQPIGNPVQPTQQPRHAIDAAPLDTWAVHPTPNPARSLPLMPTLYLTAFQPFTKGNPKLFGPGCHLVMFRDDTLVQVHKTRVGECRSTRVRTMQPRPMAIGNGGLVAHTRLAPGRYEALVRRKPGGPRRLIEIEVVKPNTIRVIRPAAVPLATTA